MKNFCRFPGKFTLAVATMEIGILILFGFFVRYDREIGYPADPRYSDVALHAQKAEDHIEKFYQMFQDIHIMMFIGFGFLMTFLKRYGFSSVGLNFLMGAFAIQWSTIINGFMTFFSIYYYGNKIPVNVQTITGADFATAAVLVSFGAVLGKTSPLQLLIMVFFEVFVYEGNYRLVIGYFEASDVGDSMTVHMFGAYFGLFVSWMLYTPEVKKMEEKEGSVYQSDLFAMIGTIFLWMSWPSFNASTANGDARVRAIVNTYYALTASCVTTFIFSSLVGRKNKLSMVHIQNATLAGGVAVGSVADMVIEPWGAILIGMVAGAVSVLGFKYLTPFLKKYLRIHDTCGIHNIHGIPGVMSGLASILAAGVAWEWRYNYNLGSVFKSGTNSASYLAGVQAICLGITLGFAIFGGVITGAVLRLPIFDHPTDHDLFDDDKFWLIPIDESLYTSNDDFSKGKGRDAELTHI